MSLVATLICNPANPALDSTIVDGALHPEWTYRFVRAEPIRFALCYDLTKAYTFVTPQFAQAAKDYAALTNLRGGIEGNPVEIIVQDHGNEPVIAGGLIAGIKKTRFNNTDFGVNVNTDNSHFGYAWGENIGWINLGNNEHYVGLGCPAAGG